MLDGTKCVIILPAVKKAAFGVGASYGRGAMTCREGEDFKGAWSAPVMMASSAASVGFQIGGEATDFVILVLNEGGARQMMKNKLKSRRRRQPLLSLSPVGRTSEASTANAYHESGTDALFFTRRARLQSVR